MVIIGAYNGHRFCRGQLWLWHDPICGNKREGVSIPSEFERCVRYTRQVLVVQNMYTLSDRSVLVIPFSGHEHTTLYNIVCISDEGNTSYALPQLMFPADVNQLIKYIGVVDEAIMNSVDSVIQSILLPTGKPNFSEDPFIIIPSATSYNPQPKYVKPETQNTQQETYRPKKYDKKKFKKGGKKNRQYNRKHFKYQDIDSYDELEEEDTNTEDINTNDNELYDMVADNSAMQQEAAVFKANHVKWDNTRRREFVESCRTNGLDFTAIKYNIKLSTAEKYLRSWDGSFNK